MGPSCPAPLDRDIAVFLITLQGPLTSQQPRRTETAPCRAEAVCIQYKKDNVVSLQGKGQEAGSQPTR